MEGTVDLRHRLAKIEASNGAPSARNLLTTVFGDAIAPRDPAAALSVASLTELVAPFGVNERLVRTSLSRLVQDGVLEVHSSGRRSYYAIGPDSLQLFASADRRIYADERLEWDGLWTMIVIDGLDATPDVRAELRGDLVERGLAVIVPNFLVSAFVQPEELSDLVNETEVNRVLVTRSRTVDLQNRDVDRRLAVNAYPIADWTSGYDRFLADFAPFTSGAIASFEPEEAFKFRIYLIASFRRLVLAQEPLPAELLPTAWIGDTARQLTIELYGQCVSQAEEYLEAVATTINGALPPLTIDPAARFGFDVPPRRAATAS